MDDAVRATLRRNLDRERICPPLIVRPLPDLAGGYQVLDGHQRLRSAKPLAVPHDTLYSNPAGGLRRCPYHRATMIECATCRGA